MNKLELYVTVTINQQPVWLATFTIKSFHLNRLEVLLAFIALSVLTWWTSMETGNVVSCINEIPDNAARPKGSRAVKDNNNAELLMWLLMIIIISGLLFRKQ